MLTTMPTDAPTRVGVTVGFGDSDSKVPVALIAIPVATAYPGYGKINVVQG